MHFGFKVTQCTKLRRGKSIPPLLVVGTSNGNDARLRHGHQTAAVSEVLYRTWPNNHLNEHASRLAAI